MKKPFRRAAKQEAPEQQSARPAAPAPPAQPAAPPAQPAARPNTPKQEYAALGTDSPIAWPSVGGRRVPVTGQLSPHARAALKRMGITNE